MRLVKVRPSLMISTSAFGHAATDRLDEVDHEFVTAATVLVAVGGDHSLVDAPGGFDLDMLLVSEQGGESFDLLVSEQVGPGRQGAAS